jgi:hypothetical protein
MILITSQNTLLLQVLVSITALTLMTAVAYYISWSRDQDRAPHARPVVRTQDDHAIADRYRSTEASKAAFAPPAMLRPHQPP